MAMKIFKVGIKREKGYLYFIDRAGDISRAKLARGTLRQDPEKIKRIGLKKESGYLYFIDKHGDISRARMIAPEANFSNDEPSLLAPGKFASGAMFEIQVLRYLTRYLEERQKTLALAGRTSCFDAILPEGIDTLHGPTAVEIRTTKKEFLDETWFARWINKIQAAEVESLLLIVGEPLSYEEKRHIAILSTKHSRVRVYLWDASELARRFKKHPMFVPGVWSSGGSSAIAHAVREVFQSEPLDWIATRKKHLADISKAYRDNKLVLFLGAGVSQSAKMPNWDTLISELMVGMIESKLPGELNASNSEKAVLSKYLRQSQSSSPLLEARLIRGGMKGSFEKAVSEALYKKCKKHATSNLLKAIAKICIPRRSGVGIRAIVTYNFDDLLEENLKIAGVQFHPIYRDVETATQDEIGIYHVHGFLPRESGEYEGISESLLVFSEEGYHALALNPYSWGNIAQLNFLRESTCLFIGLSLTDPNLRRLLDISARRTLAPKHYLIAHKPLVDKASMRPELIQPFLQIHEKLQENSYQELGLNMVWVKDFTEIPGILAEIHKQTNMREEN